MSTRDERPTILLADDDPEHREMWAQYLAYDDYRIETAADGHEALRIVERTPVQLVLLDVVMPGLDGFEVLAELRRRASPEQLPVILATGRDATADVLRGFELGANDYVTKPIDPMVLSARIRRRLLTQNAPEDHAPKDHAPIGAEGDDLAAGTVLQQRYRVEELIGRGGCGAVYRATHLQLRMPVALKLLAANNACGTARLHREGISACRLDHPNAVEVMDFCAPASGAPFLVLELLDGHPLNVELDRHEALPPRRCAQLLRPLCAVLTAAHDQGIVHRDIKPHNVFLHRARGQEVVKVLDFGIAKIFDESDVVSTQTLAGELVGTPTYMAPERFSEEPYDGHADVYSLGVMLYEMLTGSRPFPHRSLSALIRAHLLDEPEPPSALRPELPPALDPVVLSALDKEPERRPSASALGEAFDAVVQA